MITSLPLILLAGALLITLGVVSILTILLVARTFKNVPQNDEDSPKLTKNQDDPWSESGKRL